MALGPSFFQRIAECLAGDRVRVQDSQQIVKVALLQVVAGRLWLLRGTLTRSASPHSHSFSLTCQNSTNWGGPGPSLLVRFQIHAASSPEGNSKVTFIREPLEGVVESAIVGGSKGAKAGLTAIGREGTRRRCTTPAQRCTNWQRLGDRATRQSAIWGERIHQARFRTMTRKRSARRSPEEAERRLQAAGDRLAVSQRELEDACRQLRDAERNAEELGKTPMETQVPDLDIVIRLDGSASTSEEIEGHKREIADLGNVLDTLAPSTGIGVVAYGDRRWRNPIYVQKIVSLSRLAVPERFVRGLEANVNDPRGRRNQDTPEALATALDRAAGLIWRSVSQRRYIVVVADAPRYAEREQAALRMAQSFASVLRQTVSTVMALLPGADPERFMRSLATAGNGSFVDARGGETMLASLVTAISRS